MTGLQFEKDFCEIMQKKGFWALNVSKDRTGAQPFDVLAIRSKFDSKVEIFAIDCKVCEADRFHLSRIEENQWAALDLFRHKVYGAHCGLAIFHSGKIYFVDIASLILAEKRGQATIQFCDSIVPFYVDDCRKYNLGSKRVMAFLMFDEQNIFDLIGRTLA